RYALAARHGVRRDDGGWRARPHFALSHSRFLDRNGARCDRGRIGARGHFLYPVSLHGHAVPVGGVPGGPGRNTGVPGRHPHWQLLDFEMAAYVLAHLSDPHLGPLPTPRLSELIGKRMTGYINWKRRRAAIHQPQVLAR